MSILADVDGHGSADVVVATASETADETAGSAVLGNPAAGPTAGRTRAVDNGVRALPPADPVPLADLRVAITSTYAAACEADGASLQGFEVTNRGSRDAQHVRVAPLCVDDGARTRVADDVQIPEVPPERGSPGPSRLGATRSRRDRSGFL